MADVNRHLYSKPYPALQFLIHGEGFFADRSSVVRRDGDLAGLRARGHDGLD